DNYLVGLTLTVGNDEYTVISNTYEEVVLDRDLSSMYVGESFNIRAKWKTNAYIEYDLHLEKERYVVLSNSENTITVNKPILFRENGFFSLSLSRPRVQITASRIIFYIEYLSDKNYRIDSVIDLRENSLT